MSSHFMMRLHGQCGGVHSYLSVEEKIPFFTLFTGVVPGTHTGPQKRCSMSQKEALCDRNGILAGIIGG